MSSITSLFGGLKPKFQIFSASGTFTPSAALLAAGGNITVKLWGAGGGGAFGNNGYSNGMGGNAGNCIISPLNISSAQTITIGTGGAGGTASNGASGGNSTFGSLLTAIGGGGGIFLTSNYLFGSNPFLKAPPNGQSIDLFYYGTSSYYFSGAGGSAKDISLGGNILPNDIPTVGGIASGGGGGSLTGGGFMVNNYNGAAGGNGYCIVEWWE